MNAWANFFVALAGAAAALTGLIFVGVSISLKSILATAHLSGRAVESIFLLMTILIIALLCLVPGQSPLSLGIEIGIIGVVGWVIMVKTDLRMLKTAEADHKRHYRRNLLFSQLAVVPYLLAAVVLVAVGPVGFYWLIPGIIFSFLKALVDSWVLLVEIHR
jgi:hypothetical protein